MKIFRKWFTLYADSSDIKEIINHRCSKSSQRINQAIMLSIDEYWKNFTYIFYLYSYDLAETQWSDQNGIEKNFESIFSFLLWMLINIDTLQGHLKRIKFSFRSGNYCIFSFGTSRMWSYFIIWLSLSMIYKLLEMLTTHYQIKDFVRAVTNEI
jgi:hypothetical protein